MKGEEKKITEKRGGAIKKDYFYVLFLYLLLNVVKKEL